MKLIMQKLQKILENFGQGFEFGLGLYAFYEFGKWMGWF